MRNEIVKRIFQYFGIPTTEKHFSILSKNNLLKKNIMIELEDGSKIQKHIWAVEGRVAGTIITALVADISVDDVKEYVLIMQMEGLTVYVLKHTETADDSSGIAFFAHEDSAWVELTNVMLAKLLVGVEQLDELLIEYKPLEDFQKLYEQLISFMNYEEITQIN